MKKKVAYRSTQRLLEGSSAKLSTRAFAVPLREESRPLLPSAF